MVNCPKCNGKAVQTYVEDGHMVTDPCYHCQGTGISTVEDVRIHKLTNVAYTLSVQAESDYQESCNTDDDGNDYGLDAAERMMSVEDYFRARVMDRQEKMAESFFQLDRGAQNLLIAWHELETQSDSKPKDVYLPSPKLQPTFKGTEIDFLGWDSASLQKTFGDDDIPF